MAAMKFENLSGEILWRHTYCDQNLQIQRRGLSYLRLRTTAARRSNQPSLLQQQSGKEDRRIIVRVRCCHDGLTYKAIDGNRNARFWSTVTIAQIITHSKEVDWRMAFPELPDAPRSTITPFAKSQKVIVEMIICQIESIILNAYLDQCDEMLSGGKSTTSQ